MVPRVFPLVPVLLVFGLLQAFSFAHRLFKTDFLLPHNGVADHSRERLFAGNLTSGVQNITFSNEQASRKFDQSALS
jgi:hypothetical protein